MREIERTKIYELKIWWVRKVSQGLRGSELERQKCGGWKVGAWMRLMLFW